jgi:hypothetical protein
VKSNAMILSSRRHESLCQPKHGWWMRSRWFLETENLFVGSESSVCGLRFSFEQGFSWRHTVDVREKSYDTFCFVVEDVLKGQRAQK